MLLEQGALCERDTFQGERCLYNALNDRIRNLLLQYDYSKSTDPLQPLAAHITSLLTRDVPKTADIRVQTGEITLDLHKFILSARSPYFARKLAAATETKSWRLSNTIPTESFDTCIRYLYLGDVVADLGDGEKERAILTGIDKLSRQLEVPQLFENILQSGDRRLTRQRRTEEVERGQEQMARWFNENVLRHRLVVERARAEEVKWERENGVFADVLLMADEDNEDDDDDDDENEDTDEIVSGASSHANGGQSPDVRNIPIGPIASRSPSRSRQRRTNITVLYPAHRAMLLRSEVFAAMFASPFREGQSTAHLQIIPVACSPAVLEVILNFLYTETADFPLNLALDVLHAADMLFIEKLKQRAALLISTLGNGSLNLNSKSQDEPDDIDIYSVIRAGWDTRVHRLEEFGARYIAYRLERYIDAPEFREIVRESAARIRQREETDTVELIDDIRYYLSERFRLRFEDAGLDEMMDENDSVPPSSVPATLTEDGNEVVQPPASLLHEDEGYAGSPSSPPPEREGFAPDLELLLDSQTGVVRTLEGELAGDEFAQDAINYQILLGKIDRLMESLGLDG